MQLIHSITYKNILAQGKVNYFANYYSYVVSNLGKSSKFEIENILSLIDKLIHQLEHGRSDKMATYVLNYLSNPILSKDNKYFKEFKTHHSTLVPLFDAFTVTPNANWIKQNKATLLSSLKTFRVLLQKTMFNSALKSIISFLKCKHKIEEHKLDLQHYTHLIAVELFNKRKSKADLERTFQAIMSRDVNQFPFCPKFLKQNKNNLEKAKRDFIKNRTFDQQFEGIKNFLKEETKTHYFIFRIGNINCEQDFVFELKDVSFLNINSKKVQSIKNNFDRKRKDYMLPYFSDEFTLYAIVKSSSKSKSNNLPVALKKADLGLQNINKTCNTSAFLDKHSYLFTSDFKNIGGSISFGTVAKNLTRISISKLISGNSFDYLKKKSISSKRHFLNNEQLYIKAKNSVEIDDYWKYLENLISKPLQSAFVNILADAVKFNEKQAIELYIRNCLCQINTNPKSLGISSEDQRKLVWEIHENKSFNFNDLKTRIKNDFFQDLINDLNNVTSRNITDYLKRIVCEIYELRNFIQHSGKSLEKSQLKLQETAPHLLSLFRREIIDLMIKNPTSKFSDIVQPFK